jgi:hypothetical protein
VVNCTVLKMDRPSMHAERLNQHILAFLHMHMLGWADDTSTF